MADYSITGDTRLDTSGFTKGISSMTVAAGNLISDLAKAAGSKLAGLAKSSVGVGMSFDASMSQVAATMGTTVDQIQSLTDTAKEMGSTTAFTATQAADALNYLPLAAPLRKAVNVCAEGDECRSLGYHRLVEMARGQLCTNVRRGGYDQAVQLHIAGV